MLGIVCHRDGKEGGRGEEKREGERFFASNKKETGAKLGSCMPEISACMMRHHDWCEFQDNLEYVVSLSAA